MSRPLTRDFVITIEDRLRTLLKEVTKTDRKWKEIEIATGIAAASWVDFNRGKKRATADMIEAVCLAWPEHALWLTAGFEDPKYGHMSPEHKDGSKSSALYFQAVIEENALRQKYADQWVKNDLGDDFNLQNFSPFDSEFIVRNVHQLLTSVPQDLSAARAKTIRAEKMRQIDLITENTIPTLDYEETEAILPALQQMLESLVKSRKGHDDETTFTLNEERIKHVLEEVKESIEKHRNQMDFIGKLRADLNKL